MILFAIYALLAVAVVWLSIKASRYIDMLDKATSLSGAFLGGVLLSAITSLPELFTSISATVLIHKPALCIGNILGSNLFNTAVLAALTVLTIRNFGNRRVGRGNRKVTLYVLLIYVALVLNWHNILNVDIFTVNIVTFVIAALYIISVRYLAGDSAPKSDEKESVGLTVKQISVRFTLAALGIIAVSIPLTYVTDAIAVRFNLGAGLAGALFLGVATSLPEVSSTAALFRMKNYDIAVGNIVGSNLFNFMILCVADVLALRQSVYDFADPQVVSLLEWGVVATALLMVMLYVRRPWVRVVSGIAVTAGYVAFLAI